MNRLSRKYISPRPRQLAQLFANAPCIKLLAVMFHSPQRCELRPQASETALSVTERLEEALGSLQAATIGILGLSFKAGTDDITDSPALDVASLLIQRGARVRSYDPAAEGRAMRDRPELAVDYHDCVTEMSEGCDAILVMTDWDEFRHLCWPDLARRVRGRTVLDARNFLDPRQLEQAGFAYIGVAR